MASSIEELSGSAAVGLDDVALVSGADGSAALEGSVVVVVDIGIIGADEGVSCIGNCCGFVRICGGIMP